MSGLTDVMPRLLEPFADYEIDWKPSGHGKELAYVDARAVMHRLDSVVPGAWSDSYRVIDVSQEQWFNRKANEYQQYTAVRVECSLTICGVTRVDVGNGGEGGSTADPFKSAYSDAFKRAAVKFGIGRHLYDVAPRAKGQQRQQRPARKEPPRANGNSRSAPPPAQQPPDLSDDEVVVWNMGADSFRGFVAANVDGYNAPPHVENAMVALGKSGAITREDYKLDTPAKRLSVYRALVARKEQGDNE